MPMRPGGMPCVMLPSPPARPQRWSLRAPSRILPLTRAPSFRLAGLRIGAAPRSFAAGALAAPLSATRRLVGGSRQSELRQRGALGEEEEEEDEYCDSCAEQV